MLGIVSCAITYALVCIPGLYSKLIAGRQNADKESANEIRGNIWLILSSLINYRNISNSAIEIANLLTNHGNIVSITNSVYRMMCNLKCSQKLKETRLVTNNFLTEFYWLVGFWLLVSWLMPTQAVYFLSWCLQHCSQ